MPAQIDPTARVEAGASLGDGVRIGPGSIVGPNVVLGDDCCLIANVYLTGRTRIGARTIVHPFAVLGGPPQSIAARDEDTRLEIGSDCTIREGVTMHRGTVAGGGLTSVGEHNYFMAYSHIAHDCHVGSRNQFANTASLAGHCVVGDDVFLGAQVGVHQFTRVGSGVMVAYGAKLNRDVIPLAMASGNPAHLFGLNSVGMRRRKMSVASMRAVRLAYRGLFFGEGTFAERTATVTAEFGDDPAVRQIVEFLQAPRRRPICPAHRRGRAGGIDRASDDGASDG